MESVELPHDWAIEGPFDIDLPGNTGKLPYAGVGWYRKIFRVDADKQGQRVSIQFDGAMSHAKVWVNGTYVGEWPYGYNSFYFDITDQIKFGGKNVVAVRLENPSDSSRWYPGAGIYRNVWLGFTEPVHVAHWGTFVRSMDVSKEQATVKISTEVQNQLTEAAEVEITQEIFPEGKPEQVAAMMSLDDVEIGADGIHKSDFTVILSDVDLWDIKTPSLYTLRTTIEVDDKVTDVYETIFGIRSAVFDAYEGFLLNGERVALNGVCLHHDLGPLGTAVYKRAIERQLELLADMGCNAIRTSHNMPAPELLEMCDRKGFVVLDEAFDCWERGKTPNDYHLLFKDWHEKDIVNFVRRDRNHPSVVVWSSGNEILEQGDTGRGHEVSRDLTGIFHREDPSRQVTAGCNYPQAANNGFQETIDVFGFNYKPHLYEKFHRDNKTIPYYSSESASCVSSRGEYFFPVSDNKADGFFNYQVSSYDLYAPSWAMKPGLEWKGIDTNYPSCAGEFVWTGFDYIGEPTPYQSDDSILLNCHNEEEKAKLESEMAKYGGKSPSRSSYFGIMDLCGFKKDRYYIYQARWRPQNPMAHILPHWNWPERVGKVTPVHVYTSGDSAELFLNGKSLGKKAKARLDAAQKLKSLSTDKKVVVSSEERDKNNFASSGNDGNMNTRWCAADGNGEQFWQVDLGEVQSVKSCVICFENEANNYKYYIKTSKDGQNWELAASSEYEGSGKTATLKFDKKARYVKVEFIELRGSIWASFYECLVYADSEPDTGKQPEYYRLRWDDVVYEPGELKVVAYKEDKEWATDVMKTTGEPAKVEISCDRDVIEATGRDISYLTVKIVDEDGLMVPRSNNLVKFEIDGPGEIIAVGNGDATSHESFKADERKAYNGMCLVVVRSVKDKAGKIRLRALSNGLSSDSVVITSK